MNILNTNFYLKQILFKKIKRIRLLNTSLITHSDSLLPYEGSFHRYLFPLFKTSLRKSKISSENTWNTV